MFQIRPFRNTDPPYLAEIWRSQPPQRGMAQPVNASMLELYVLSKQFFDPQGLLVATRDGLPIGFAHAGFGCDDSCSQLDCGLGTTQILLVHHKEDDPAIADALIKASEEYQKSRGATVHYAGGVNPLNGFYLGLYGGSELPGILDSDQSQGAHFLRNNYEASSRIIVLQRELLRFRSSFSRDARKVRRDTELEQVFLPKARNWWEACISGPHDRIRYSLRRRSDRQEIASVIFWEIEPLAASWGIPTAGMIELQVDPELRRMKVATHLVSESLRHVQRRGAAMVEVQAMADNEAALGLYDSLGFKVVDHGTVFRRAAES